MELEQVSSSNKGANLAEGKLNWEQTSLKPYVEVFQEFVDGVVKAHRGVKKEGEFFFKGFFFFFRLSVKRASERMFELTSPLSLRGVAAEVSMEF